MLLATIRWFRDEIAKRLIDKGLCSLRSCLNKSINSAPMTTRDKKPYYRFRLTPRQRTTYSRILCLATLLHP